MQADLAGGRDRAVWGVVALWLLAITCGMALLIDYQQRPGPAGDAPEQLPFSSRESDASARKELLFFAHPRCPCTRASMAELARVMARAPATLCATVWFFKPEDAGDEWAMTDLWRRAKEIPGVKIKFDAGGREALRFGAETSGHVLLYDHRGTLLYSGGITGSRGHEGDNASKDALLARLLADGNGTARASIYGCLIREPESPRNQ